MPDKPFTVITYAASASLAAIALVYFFNPNYLIDGETSGSSASSRKKGVVGLLNPANDCFINSVLQSLAGLGELRLYLIRELHRRKLDGPEAYTSVPRESPGAKPVDAVTLQSLQRGEVTQGLKDMLDHLNERPIFKKTISARSFILVLEHAFGTRISRAQQDAQELLQIVAERLSEEYEAGKAARKRAREASEKKGSIAEEVTQALGLSFGEELLEKCQNNTNPSVVEEDGEPPGEEESGFPMEGRTESEIECQFCHFIPKASPVTFVMLTLTVPQKSSTTLNECFDGLLKTEYIDDYKCDKCRLEHALETFKKDFDRASASHRREIYAKIKKVEAAIAEDPEKPPEGVELPDTRLAPERRIARHVKITSFPKILVIHLSRSIYDSRSSSTKNIAKVAFPERLPLGGILDRRNYKLLDVVSHKGTHNSGHYESFRRQNVYAPYSTPHNPGAASPYSTAVTPNLSAVSSPRLPPSLQAEGTLSPRMNPETLSIPSPSVRSPSPSLSSTSTPSTRPSSGSASGSTLHNNRRTPTSAPHQPAELVQEVSDNSGNNAQGLSSRFSMDSRPSIAGASMTDLSRLGRKKKKSDDRWWRISDDKIKECKTSDVLAMQKEVYMLFYEMEKG
ncbi:MAG: hypothetical protein MMC33_009109 [Icmadophila ericetorum]|nr:hypothetical protein [Icmadophila ericetorum]